MCKFVFQPPHPALPAHETHPHRRRLWSSRQLFIFCRTAEHRLPDFRQTANPSITSTYTKTVAVCCNRCKAQFNATPKAYLNNIVNAVTGQCPLSKKKADPSVTVSYTRQVAFADVASKTAFDAAPDKHIKEVRQ